MISVLLDITLEVSYWVLKKTTIMVYSGITYFNSKNVPERAALEYTGDKTKDVIYAAGILHHENLLDKKDYDAILDSSLTNLTKDDKPPSYYS